MERPDPGESTADRFLALLKPIERDLETFGSRMVWQREDAPDAIQNAVMRAFAAFDRYQETASFRAWMFKILTREAFALNRKYARVARHEFQVDPEELDNLSLEDSLASPDGPGLSLENLQDTLDESLVTGLKMLTDNERAVLLLRSIGGFRYLEIAQSLEIPIGSVMGHLARARQKMRALLARPKPQNDLPKEM